VFFPCHRRQRSGHRPGRHNQKYARMFITGRRRRRRFVPQAQAAQQRLKHASAPPSTTAKYVRCTASGAAGNGLGTAIEYLRHT
jgi:hypothetical protein